MKIYIAAMYSLKDQMREYRDRLRADGHEIVSTWMDETHDATSCLADISPNLLAQYARNDLKEIAACDVILFFSEEPTVPTRRGGRHVEFGYALAWKKKIVVCGPQENIFHLLPQIQFVEDFAHARILFKQIRDKSSADSQPHLQTM